LFVARFRADIRDEIRANPEKIEIADLKQAYGTAGKGWRDGHGVVKRSTPIVVPRETTGNRRQITPIAVDIAIAFTGYD
jgi:hypothetical protein